MLHDMESRVIIMKNVEPDTETKERRNCIVRPLDAHETKMIMMMAPTQAVEGCWGERSDFRKRDEKNVLDQNVNGKEVKRVIYFWKRALRQQQLKLLILWSFTSWSNLFRISRRLPPDGKLWSFSSPSFSIVDGGCGMRTTQCVIKLEKKRL